MNGVLKPQGGRMGREAHRHGRNGSSSIEYRDRFLASSPFMPEVVDVLSQRRYQEVAEAERELLDSSLSRQRFKVSLLQDDPAQIPGTDTLQITC
jgi:hypothetical protein